MSSKYKSTALQFDIMTVCKTSGARAAILHLPHGQVKTPVFMPVATQASLKAVDPKEIEAMNCEIILNNTYHLGHRPGADIVARAGGTHTFQNWSRNILTDSGGFQIVSLAKRLTVTEEGVEFMSPYTNETMLMRPEDSIDIQSKLGSDIMMQLDHVVHACEPDEKTIEDAMWRTIRWLDRCISAHKNKNTQNLFPIVQGGIHKHLRVKCIEEMIKREAPGFAVGGLSGGEEKESFCKTMKLCADLLPKDRPRYGMGIGYLTDLVVCTALGYDMFDCVYPTRTARFGMALTWKGKVKVKSKQCVDALRPIDESCLCTTCKSGVTRAFLNATFGHEAVTVSLITVHNVYFMLDFMSGMRQSIIEQRFPQFVKDYCTREFGREIPAWVCEALRSVNIIV